ncbi:MAG: hypothetical protein H8E44_34655 [Planctomycetes bacterium]|nr:hypothetical protein [Planctomycetota bacterium]MBL7040360.1 hypothetical protein [Pirellulaceae bacterium]
MLGLRLLTAIACVIAPSAAMVAQPAAETPSKYPFRPRRPAIATSNSREAINTLKNKLARLREQAAQVMPRSVETAEISRLARQISETDDLLQDLTQYKPKRHVGIALERLTLPAKQLTYRECCVSAVLYHQLFLLVHDDRKVDFGTKAIEYLEQYVKLAGIRKEVWAKLKAEGIPVDGNRTAPFGLADERGDGLKIFEFNGGFYCVHLWFAGGHQYTSFVVHPDGALEYATLDLAARIVGDAQGQPQTTDRAIRFLQEVLRVLPYESKVISSVQDIPSPAGEGLTDQDVARNRGALQTFFKGKGQSVTHPTRAKVRGDAEYTIYVYQSLGGQVIRYQIRCNRVGHVRIREETIARWIGDHWGIM